MTRYVFGTRVSLALCAVALLYVLGPSPAAAPAMPQRPRTFVNTAFPSQKGHTIAVPRGGDFQSALNQAQPGDTITLEAGATYRGPFVLPNKPGNGWIVIRTDAPDSRLPIPGTRIDPSDAKHLPKLVASRDPVVSTAPGAHHYRFVGVEISPTPGSFLYEVVSLGGDTGSLADMPHHLIFDRCYIHGDKRAGSRHGVVMNSSQTAIIDSYLSDIKEVGADSQALVSWNGSGPFKIEDNHIEASGEDVLFGGADPSIRNLVPSDIEIRRNLFTKDLSWKSDDPSYAGKPWQVKNLLELKNAQRLIVSGNVFQYNWPEAQTGFAVLMTVRNQDGTAPWSTVQDVAFVNNVVQHVGSGVNILGHDDLHPSQQTRRILIRNNFFNDVGGSWGDGRLFQILSGVGDLIVDHNTAFQTGSFIIADGQPNSGFMFENNIVQNNLYGLAGGGTGLGTPSLRAYFPGAIFKGNVIVGGDASEYPSGNFFPGSPKSVGFTDTKHNNYRLSSDSHYRGAGTDGADIGADFDALYSALTTNIGLPGTTPLPHAIPRPPGSVPRPGGPLALNVNLAQAAIPFWPFVLLLGYTYLGYPLAIRLRAERRRRALLRPPGAELRTADPPLPHVSLLVIAYNEAGRISDKIENLLQLDYPRDALEIVIASDGSTDETVARARAYEPAGVRTVAFARRRGKPAVLDEVVPSLKGRIVVLADARQMFERDALMRLVAPFADDRVGAVSGELILRPKACETGIANGVGFYWHYEKFLRLHESAVDSTLGATGAIYAIRRELFEPIPADTILDDVVIPARIVRRGFRVLFEPRARAYDDPFATASAELARKTRTIAGTFQLFARERWLLLPWENRIWFQTVSHKGLRLLLPAFHAGAFVTNVALAFVSPFYEILLIAQILFYTTALAGALLKKRGARPIPLFSLLSVPYAMCLLNWATMIAFARFATGRQQATWQRAFDAGGPMMTASSRRRRVVGH
jgi:cellulose synthase/poly-beta-1,6-N-acetylglucosamine synthase-like glycosyltransferase